MTIGIGGAGSKLAVALDPESTIINVSETELNKLNAGKRILAVVHAAGGQLRGSRKNPQIGRDAFLAIKREILHLLPGDMVFSSTGGGTGNGITASILEELTFVDNVDTGARTTFALVLPYARLEPVEFVTNTVDFLRQPLSDAIDSGNTGNIFLFTNRLKFESRLPEAEYNGMLVDSLRAFLAVPHKGEGMRLLDGHIDFEDFNLYLARPYFNHFTYFDLDPSQDIGKQFSKNLNPYLLPPDNPIEALFLLEVPPKADISPFYDILDYFAANSVSPVYGVVENPELETYFLTMSVLYSRKPDELVEDFNRVSQEHTQAKVRKSLEQHVSLPKLEVNLETEVKRAAKQKGAEEREILAILKRLGKI